MNDLRAAAQQALSKLEDLRVTIDSEWGDCRDLSEIESAGEQWKEVTALRAALTTQSTHSADCWKWHHECAIARIEELKLLCEEMLSELYVYRASQHFKDAAAAIRARGDKR